MLTLLRFHSSPTDTLGLLRLDGQFLAFTLEDEYRAVKVMSETRIPEGTYTIELYDSPSHSKRYGHKMLHLKDVPGFTGILIHKGNSEVDTAGCLLVGNHCQYNPFGSSRITESTLAYDRIYPIIAALTPIQIQVQSLGGLV